MRALSVHLCGPAHSLEVGKDHCPQTVDVKIDIWKSF